jgi:hypothetical protein
MVTLQAKTPIIAAQTVIVAAITMLILYLVKASFGRAAFIALGLTLLFLAGLTLLRLRK